ncbi:Glucose dehydrogenase [FAD, quinone] [Blattella germanica]|nr:Glucose dehydrogenase [FAD, quinone] [Blattella germanica]
MFILFSVTCCCSYQEEYDFIIVGAGAAGCLLANRLSEDSNSTVLLIETGDRENFIEDIPKLAALPQLTPVNWGYETEKSSPACNTGWSYDEVLPYFLKFENMLIPELANDTKYHSTKGELAINQAPFHTKASLALLEAAREKGAKDLD